MPTFTLTTPIKKLQLSVMPFSTITIYLTYFEQYTQTNPKTQATPFQHVQILTMTTQESTTYSCHPP